MLSEFEKNLEKFADVILKIGLNLQPGQKLLIGAPILDVMGVPIELAPLVRIITKKAYQLGANFVEIMWEDDQNILSRFKHAPRDSFKEFPSYRSNEAIKTAKAGEAILWIISGNPDLLKTQDPNLISSYLDSCWSHYKPILDLRHKNAMNHSLVACPHSGWANKLFPSLSQKEQIERFWDLIFEICRVKNDDPILAWRNHINNLKSRCSYLNEKQYKELNYIAPGTNLTIGLPKEHIWRAGSFKTQGGIEYIVNIPTEEIFTIPHREKTEGVVSATKPRVGEVMIEDFSLTFSKGRVIEASAKKGEEFLLKRLKSDDRASFLGEVALVPHSSPISQTGTIFYETLIDENASCHLALGQCIRLGIVDGASMSDDDLLAAGCNISGIHLDFMIGSGKMNVDGILENGEKEAIIRNGEWAFKV